MEKMIAPLENQIIDKRVEGKHIRPSLTSLMIL